MSGKLVNSIAELIGDTPAVRLNRLTSEEHAEVYVKLEYFNPSGSVKDRAAYNLITQAEKDGLLRVIDESGEDDLYPKSAFRPITLPNALKKAVLAT